MRTNIHTDIQDSCFIIIDMHVFSESAVTRTARSADFWRMLSAVVVVTTGDSDVFGTVDFQQHHSLCLQQP